MIRPIAPSLSPNTQLIDVWNAVLLMLIPFHIIKGNSLIALKQWFCNYFSVSAVFLFTSGRGALFFLLSSLGLRKDDEVLIQAFTCVAVPNAVLWAGAKPVYVDITSSFEIDFTDLKKKVTSNTKVIIVQHTFGIPAVTDEIIHFLQQKKIIIIEDCAHGIGGVYQRKKLGQLGDAAFFSFGRDKAFSSVFGGVALVHSRGIFKKVDSFYETFSYPSVQWTFQQLFHPIAFFFILPLYNVFSIGKLIIVLFQRFHLLSVPVEAGEKQSNPSYNFVQKMPNALSILALLQLKKLNTFNEHRIKISNYYNEYFSRKGKKNDHLKNKVLLRYPVLIQNKKAFLSYCKSQKILLGNWYSQVVDPQGVNLEKVLYTKGSCPQAENIAATVVNFPTYQSCSIKDAEKIVKLYEEYERKRDN